MKAIRKIRARDTDKVNITCMHIIRKLVTYHCQDGDIQRTAKGWANNSSMDINNEYKI
jgi:hypothetical protein